MLSLNHHLYRKYRFIADQDQGDRTRADEASDTRAALEPALVQPRAVRKKTHPPLNTKKEGQSAN